MQLSLFDYFPQLVDPQNSPIKLIQTIRTFPLASFPAILRPSLSSGHALNANSSVETIGICFGAHISEIAIGANLRQHSSPCLRSSRAKKGVENNFSFSCRTEILINFHDKRSKAGRQVKRRRRKAQG